MLRTLHESGIKENFMEVPEICLCSDISLSAYCIIRELWEM